MSFPAIVGGFILSIGLFATGLGGTTYPIWYRFLPAQQATDGTWHRGTQYGTDWFVDTPPRIALQAAADAADHRRVLAVLRYLRARTG